MRRLAVLLILSMAMSGCASASLIAKYSFELTKVEKPKDVTKRYGGKKIILNEETQYTYEDELLKIIFIPTTNWIDFTLENKTDYSLSIIWDETVYVDTNLSSHRVIHQGVRYLAKNEPQSPSVVASKSSVTDLIMPGDYVVWDNCASLSYSYYSTYCIGGWIEKPLFPTTIYQTGISAEQKKATEEDFVNSVEKYRGKEFSLVFPVKVQDIINEYKFFFKIRDIQIPGLKELK